MLLLTSALAVSLVSSAAPSLAELKIDPHRFDANSAEFLAEGATWLPSRWILGTTKLEDLSGETRAALTREALLELKAWVMSDAGRAAWSKRLAGRPSVQVAEQAATVASSLAWYTTLVKERRVKDPADEKGLANAKRREAAFKAQRAQLLKHELTREKAAAQADDAAFKLQLRERLSWFLDETKRIDFQAKLVEDNGRKYFVDPKLEAKPNWWKLCFRAGPEATSAAREVATAWLAELDAPPSKLSEEK
ncbi:MAG: hypothetical protein ACOZQL_14660 [Myxococcota bacterium]